MKISCVIITKNEEANIERCLSALHGTVDEIVIIDSDSTDRTTEIARSYGARVIMEPWLGYAKTKNLGHSRATNPWILSLDADEVLSTELADSIRNVDVSNPSQVFFVNRLTYFGHHPVKHSGWHPDRIPRLFHRDHAQWEGDFVHERLAYDSSMMESHLTGLLHHYSYKNLEDLKHRTAKYVELKAKAKAAQGKKPNDLKALIAAAWAFFKSYVLQKGLLDGHLGWTIAQVKAQAQIQRNKVLKSLLKDG